MDVGIHSSNDFKNFWESFVQILGRKYVKFGKVKDKIYENFQ